MQQDTLVLAREQLVILMKTDSTVIPLPASGCESCDEASMQGEIWRLLSVLLYSIVCGVLVAFVVLSPASSASTGSAQQEDKSSSAEKGKLIVETACQGCHSFDLITRSHHTLDEWRAIVDQMISNGAPLRDDEVEPAVQYLARNFGPAKLSKGSEKKKE